MISTSFWEAYVEGRNSWDKKKLGWKIKIGTFTLSAYHFFLFGVMFPLLLSLPLVIYGWNTRIFGIILSAYVSGAVVEDFFWFVVNPKVKLKEFYSEFTDYYPWVKIAGKKIVPLGYVLALFISFLSWYFLWK